MDRLAVPLEVSAAERLPVRAYAVEYEPPPFVYRYALAFSKPGLLTRLEPEMTVSFNAVCAVTALPSAVAALVTPVFAVDRTADATVWTSVGSLPVLPDDPFRPSQKLLHAVCSLVLTVA